MKAGFCGDKPPASSRLAILYGPGKRMLADRATLGDVDAWMRANADNRAWNACAIVKGRRYVYFRKILRRIPLKRRSDKEDW